MDSGVEVELRRLYDQALRRAALPYRSPSHRIAEQLAATAEASAYARSLALVTDEQTWSDTALRLARMLRERVQMGQSDIDDGDRAESTVRRFGLR